MKLPAWCILLSVVTFAGTALSTPASELRRPLLDNADGKSDSFPQTSLVSTLAQDDESVLAHHGTFELGPRHSRTRATTLRSLRELRTRQGPFLAYATSTLAHSALATSAGAQTGGEAVDDASAQDAPADDDPAASDEGQPADAPKTFDLSHYQRVRGVANETRVFWYAAGASALTSLVVRVLAFGPAVVAGVVIATISLAVGPAATMALVVGLLVATSTLDAALAALSSSLAFDQLSEFYTSSYLASFAGHFLGNAIAVGVGGVTVGFGLSLILGTTILSPFIGTTIPGVFTVFSFFGLIPAIVVGFFTSVALPALIGAWAISASARPKEGFIVDPGWDPLNPSSSTKPDPVPRGERRVGLFAPKLVIPGT